MLGIKSKDWKVGVVSAVVKGSQAQKHGVKPGWKMVKVEHKSYKESILDSYIAKKRPFTITFYFPNTSNLTEQKPPKPQAPTNKAKVSFVFKYLLTYDVLGFIKIEFSANVFSNLIAPPCSFQKSPELLFFEVICFL